MDIARLESKTTPASNEVVSELLMIVEFKGLEYEIRFKWIPVHKSVSWK